jgi:hypothetical protein
MGLASIPESYIESAVCTMPVSPHEFSGLEHLGEYAPDETIPPTWVRLVSARIAKAADTLDEMLEQGAE